MSMRTFFSFLLLCATTIGCTSVSAEPIRGAGSTFAAPAIEYWGKLYSQARADGGDYIAPDWAVDYERIGSLAGILRLSQPEMDFAATDVPVDSAILRKLGRQQFPILIGAIAVVINLDGLPSAGLKLTGPVLADILRGEISNWSHPALRSLNPDVALPDLPIAVIHRSDGSGSTYALASYLSEASAEWKSALGADTRLSWPAGRGVEGTTDLLVAVKSTEGAIGYAEFGQVRRSGLPIAAIQNTAGRFVQASAAGAEAAAASVAWRADEDFSVSLIDQPGENAYPITAATFVILPLKERAPSRYRRVINLFTLAFERGASGAADLGFVPIPLALIEQIEAYWADGQANDKQ